MTPLHLQALRRLLFFSVEQAALWVAAGPERPRGVAPRAWQYWERGERAVPDDVATTMLALAAWRARAIAAIEAAIRDGMREGSGPERIALLWYTSAEDWCSLPGREPIHWRPHCSALAHVAAEQPNVVRLVAYDAQSYARWRGQRRDGELMRARWAATIDTD